MSSTPHSVLGNIIAQVNAQERRQRIATLSSEENDQVDAILHAIFAWLGGTTSWPDVPRWESYWRESGDVENARYCGPWVADVSAWRPRERFVVHGLTQGMADLVEDRLVPMGIQVHPGHYSGFRHVALLCLCPPAAA